MRNHSCSVLSNPSHSATKYLFSPKISVTLSTTKDHEPWSETDMSSTISDILASQSSLVEEAAEALPFQFNQCTYSLGPIRQAVYLCTTCAVPRGICSACSIACHTDHEQLELFPKRHFRCDCPTSSPSHSCTLHTHLEQENTDNAYGQNFNGLFCRCSRIYDAQTEKETMIQCLACEVCPLWSFCPPSNVCLRIGSTNHV